MSKIINVFPKSFVTANVSHVLSNEIDNFLGKTRILAKVEGGVVHIVLLFIFHNVLAELALCPAGICRRSKKILLAHVQCNRDFSQGDLA